MSKYRTLIVSDTHLGSDESKPDKLYNFLKENTSDILILNGDIVDIKYAESLNKEVDLNYFLQIIENFNSTKIIYLTGNHDHQISKYYNNSEIFTKFNWYKHTDIKGKTHFICHGDKHIFDNFITNSIFLENIIKYLITFLNHLKRVHKGFIFQKNKILKKELEYYSLSDNSRCFIKKGLKILSLYERKITIACDFMKSDGIICGHIHLPEIKTINGKIYMNSGDFVENFSALVETHNGEWKIIYDEKR